MAMRMYNDAYLDGAFRQLTPEQQAAAEAQANANLAAERATMQRMDQLRMMPVPVAAAPEVRNLTLGRPGPMQLMAPNDPRRAYVEGIGADASRANSDNAYANLMNMRMNPGQQFAGPMQRRNEMKLWLDRKAADRDMYADRSAARRSAEAISYNQMQGERDRGSTAAKYAADAAQSAADAARAQQEAERNRPTSLGGGSALIPDGKGGYARSDAPQATDVKWGELKPFPGRDGVFFQEGPNGEIKIKDLREQSNAPVFNFGPTEGGGDVQGDRPLSTEDQTALDWAKKNPNDPRSAQILRRLGR